MLLQKYHFQIFEYLDKDKITSQIFKEYNEANPNYKMEAQNHVCYCMAVKKGDL